MAAGQRPLPGAPESVASTEAVLDAAERPRDAVRGATPAIGRAIGGLHASAGNGAISRLFAAGTPAVRPGRTAATERPVVQASLDDEAAAPVEEAGSTEADVTGEGSTPAELAAGAPTPGPSWTKVGPPTPGSFTVSGTLREVATALAARPEAGSETATASRDYDVWTPEGGEETILAARVTVKQDVQLPTWSDKSKATKNQQAEWDRFHAAITTHEAGHVSTDKTSFAGTHSKMIGKSPTDGDTELTTAETQATTDNKTYDTTTNSGLNQGTGINANIDEVTKVP